MVTVQFVGVVCCLCLSMFVGDGGDIGGGDGQWMVVWRVFFSVLGVCVYEYACVCIVS